MQRARVRRLLVVGGAGSLYVAPGVQLVDTPSFLEHVPANVVPGAQAARDFLTELRRETQLDWVYVSPPALLKPGARSGRYRVGADDLLMDGDKPAGMHGERSRGGHRRRDRVAQAFATALHSRDLSTD